MPPPPPPPRDQITLPRVIGGGGSIPSPSFRMTHDKHVMVATFNHRPVQVYDLTNLTRASAVTMPRFSYATSGASYILIAEDIRILRTWEVFSLHELALVPRQLRLQEVVSHPPTLFDKTVVVPSKPYHNVFQPPAKGTVFYLSVLRLAD